jgi:hypothetical protein
VKSPGSPTEFLASVGISLAVLVAATLLKVVLEVAARKDGGPPGSSAPPQMFTWEDAVFWNDWTTNILVAFGIFAIQGLGGGPVNPVSISILVTCAAMGLLILPGLIRWLGCDPTTGKISKSGMYASNAGSFIIIVLALVAGVDLL